MSRRDESFMRLALELAAKGRGRTRPNPMVGAVLVKKGRIVGQDFHRRAGQPHAEVLALRQAGTKARGATLYVSLEPCAHTGRTPPCTEAITAAGVNRVVAAMVDPNRLNRGRGLRRLRAQGIKTEVGVLEKEARALNEIFITRMTRSRPFVTVKVAQSLDGKIATRAGGSRWISGPAAREWVHRLRAQVDAILVGIQTVLKDDPRLTVRLGSRGGEEATNGRRPPIKIVLDSRLRTPVSARIFSSGSSVILATTNGAPRGRQQALERAGAQILRLPSRNGLVDFKTLLKELSKREISHLLVEGGGQVIASAFEAGAVDRVACVIAPMVIGGKEAPTSVEGIGIPSLDRAVRLRNVKIRRLGPDFLVTGDVYRNR